jgi:hypothetical protein
VYPSIELLDRTGIVRIAAHRLPHLIVGSLSAFFVVPFSREEGGRPMRVSCLITIGYSLVAATARDVGSRGGLTFKRRSGI